MITTVRGDILEDELGVVSSHEHVFIDSLERLVGRVYTHFPDKLMTRQMDLLQFEF